MNTDFDQYYESLLKERLSEVNINKELSKIIKLYKCPVCGKTFCKAPQHQYKTKSNVLVCSYTCAKKCKGYGW